MSRPAERKLLATMPGIGPRAGARILAEIGDGSAFATGSKLAAHAGLAPVIRQSGTSLNTAARSQRGNHRLKNAMFLAAFASLRDLASKTFYDRKRAEGKRHNAALICLARRRCDVILAMLRTPPALPASPPRTTTRHRRMTHHNPSPPDTPRLDKNMGTPPHVVTATGS